MVLHDFLSSDSLFTESLLEPYQYEKIDIVTELNKAMKQKN